MLAIAIANGAARDLGYRKFMSERAAHQLSTVSACLLFTFYIKFVMHAWPPTSASMAFAVGALWLVLTLIFEFGFGRARGRPWAVLLRDYNILAGRLWVLIPLLLLFAPYLFYSFR